MDIPRNLELAMLNAIHTSAIDGNRFPISLCYAAVSAVLAEQQGIYQPTTIDVGSKEPTNA